MPVLSTPLTERLSGAARASIASTTADLPALLRRLQPSPEATAVFKSLTRAVVPRLCDASTVWISTTGQQPSHLSFRVSDSDGYEQCCGAEAAVRTGLNAAAITEDRIVIPIEPAAVEGQPCYRGVLTLIFHGSRPTLAHLLIGQLLVERAISLVQRQRLLDKVDNLQQALSTNREIGAAMGILMARHQLTDEQAFALLRRASQRSHRKVVLIAAEVVRTGALELPPGVELLDCHPTPGPPARSRHLRLAH